MKLVFDLAATQPLGSSQFHGGGQYATFVFDRLIQLGVKFEATYDSRRPLGAHFADTCQANGVRLHPVLTPSDLVQVLRASGCERFYSALPYEYGSFDFGDVRVVLTVHGLRPLEMPTDSSEGFAPAPLRARLRRMAKATLATRYDARQARRFNNLLRVRAKSATFVVPSLHTKHAILSLFPTVSADQITVLYSPRSRAQPDPSASRELLQRLGVKQRKFVLLLGADRWLKNAKRGIRALDGLLSRHPDIAHDVLVLGASEPRPYLRGLRAPARFKFSGYVSDTELATLYANASCLLYPSLNEGFGYPPVECMAAGTPVIAAAVTSVTEICADAALYVNPFSIREMQARLHMLLTDQSIWSDYAQRGKKRALVINRLQDEMLDQLIRLISR